VVRTVSGGSKTVGCDYIKEDGINNDQLANRQNRWCGGSDDNVKAACKKSCGTCQSGGSSGSYPGDIASFRFEVYTSTGGTEQVGCSWINEDGISDAQLQNRVTNHCIDRPTGQKCGASCGKAIDRLNVNEGGASGGIGEAKKKSKHPKMTKAPTTFSSLCDVRPDRPSVPVKVAAILPLPEIDYETAKLRSCRESNGYVYVDGWESSKYYLLVAVTKESMIHLSSLEFIFI
jgi:hypothetical protein